MSVEKLIQDKIQQRKDNIMKGFVDKKYVSPKEAIENSNLEKARNVGETKVGKDGITRVWTQLPNGKFDWRRKSGKPAENKTVKPDSSDKKEVKMRSLNQDEFRALSDKLKNLRIEKNDLKDFEKRYDDLTYKGAYKDRNEFVENQRNLWLKKGFFPDHSDMGALNDSARNYILRKVKVKDESK